MRWENAPESEHVDDRRQQSDPFTTPGSTGSRKARLGAGASVALLLVGFVVSSVFDIDLSFLFQNPPSPSTHSQNTHAPSPDQDRLARFSSVILRDTEIVWTKLFKQMGKTYQPPTLVLFTNVVHTACGLGESATGPFYCPADHKAYIDLGFYRVMVEQLGAPGDFAQAYVLAHEIGHHVQNLLGTNALVSRLSRQLPKQDANKLSVLLELQADCFAGVWAHYAEKDRNMLEDGDIEEGLHAANQIGDDTLQRNAGRAVRPESFTHGTSKQRKQWLLRGKKLGTIDACDTFNGRLQAP